VPSEGTINLEEWFWCQRPAFYSTGVAIALLALVANADYLKTANAALFFRENAVVLGFFVPNLLGLNHEPVGAACAGRLFVWAGYGFRINLSEAARKL
jgi:hypothetical protein